MNQIKKAQVVIIAGHQHYHLMKAVEVHGEMKVVEALAQDIVERAQATLWQARTRAGIELEAALALQNGEGRYKIIRERLDVAAKQEDCKPVVGSLPA